jgi:ribosomal protein S18 acetylase RimI-like enzyme
VDDELARIEGFCRWVEDETSTKTTTWRYGTALFHEDFPDFYDHNFLRVERPVGDATARELAKEADELLAGFAHREIVVGDEADGERLAPGFADLGWRTERLLYQIRRRRPDRPAPNAAREVGIDEMMPFREETWRRLFEAPAVPLAAFGRVLADRIGARFFVAEVDGVMAAGCELYQHDGVAQIETVDTLEEYRGRGLARSVVLAATDAALAAGADLVLIVADDDDWPKHLYSKLGFDPAGRFWQFTLPPPITA